jgi:hypothetical protein
VFNELLERRAVSARVLRQIAKSHGIAYSTLQSWRTGEHLPRVPDDIPCFRVVDRRAGQQSRHRHRRAR